MDKEKLEEELKTWIDSNKEILPINIEYWKITARFVETNANFKIMSFGAYQSSSLHTSSFYKPLSRIIKIK